MSHALFSKPKLNLLNPSFKRIFCIGHICNLVKLRKQSPALTQTNTSIARTRQETSTRRSRSTSRSNLLDLSPWIPGIGSQSQPKFNHPFIMSSTAIEGECLDANRLVWIDLEMTGLNVEKERIIEIACLVTEGDLTIVAKGPNLVIHQEDKLLDSMDEWCTIHHGQSGLTEAVRNSTISTEEAEAKVLSFVQQYVPQGKCPLAGNSVSTDRLFLERYMPRLARHLHYRIVDVSTVKELCRRWYPEDLKNAPAKKLTHRAMDDIVESIEELKYYQRTVFKS